MKNLLPHGKDRPMEITLKERLDKLLEAYGKICERCV